MSLRPTTLAGLRWKLAKLRAREVYFVVLAIAAAGELREDPVSRDRIKAPRSVVP